MILEAAKSIIAATSALVRAASAAQRELIDQVTYQALIGVLEPDRGTGICQEYHKSHIYPRKGYFSSKQRAHRSATVTGPDRCTESNHSGHGNNQPYERRRRSISRHKDDMKDLHFCLICYRLSSLIGGYFLTTSKEDSLQVDM